MADRATLVERVRRACVRLPDLDERQSHGAPTFFIRGKRSFLMVWPEGHHNNHFPHLWAAAADGVQGELIASDPDQFFRPPYVGHRGWVGVRLDTGISDAELAELAEDAYRHIAPAKLVAALDAQSGA